MAHLRSHVFAREPDSLGLTAFLVSMAPYPARTGTRYVLKSTVPGDPHQPLFRSH